MMTIEKTHTGLILGILQDYSWEYIPCDNMDMLEIEAYKRGLLLKDNTPIWYDAYSGVANG